MAFAVDLTGSILDRRYRLTGLLGKGGMGYVYEAVHVALDQRVAVKVLHPRYAYEERFRERFLQEARAASKIRHRNVVEIKDFGETPDGSVYFAMEYLHGHDVGAELQRHDKLPWGRTRNILLQAASALHAAHAKKIIHRDIKPGNCFLIDDDAEGLVDVVKLLDFGIAKVGSDSHADAQGKGLTGTGEVFGTASYMSPEQARGEVLDARSDMYSLGIMAYEMLVGQVPFTGVNAIHVITRHLRDRPEPLRTYDERIPAAVETLVLKMLAKEPRDRYASMAEVEQALREIPEDAGARRTRVWSSPGELRALVAGKKAGGGAGRPPGPAAASSSGPMTWAAADGTDADRTEAVAPKAGMARGAVKRTVVSTDRAPGPAAVAVAPARAAAPAGVAARARAATPVPAAAAGRAATPSPAAAPVPARVQRSATAPAPVAAPMPAMAEPAGATVSPSPTLAAATAQALPFGAVSSAAGSALSPTTSGSGPQPNIAAAAGSPPGWPVAPRSDGTNPPPGRDVSGSTWPASTASTGPQMRLGDTGTETRPHSLEAVGAPGISARLLLVVGLLVVLVGGVSVLGTMAFLSKEERPEPAAIESQPDAVADEAAPAGERVGVEALPLEREVPVHEAAVPDADAPSPIPGPSVEGGSKEVGIEGDVVVDEPAKEPEMPAQPAVGGDPVAAKQPKVPVAPKVLKHESAKCASVRDAAPIALDKRKWGEAAELAKQRECWPPAEQGIRRRIQVNALLELGRFADCIAAGSKATDPATLKNVETCRKRLSKQ